jgi:hypothetical protein
MGGPGNSLNVNYSYSVEKYVKFIAERAHKTNVGLVSLFKRYDKPWINGRARRINVWLDWAHMWCDMTHWCH